MDPTDDEFRTLQGETETRIKVQGSTFLGRAAPVQTQAAAEEFIRRGREEHFDATHHCYAYRLGTQGDRYRLHDDGEPGGTGGRPILTAIDRAGLTDVVVVVTRWFGGTKLGVGGLARAYGQAAEQALGRGTVETRYELAGLRVTFSHDQTSAVMREISRSGARVRDTVYDTRVHLSLRVRRSVAGRLLSALTDATRGAAVVEPDPAGDGTGLLSSP
jgi:uncharacterized YigZ family protein